LHVKATCLWHALAAEQRAARDDRARRALHCAGGRARLRASGWWRWRPTRARCTPSWRHGWGPAQAAYAAQGLDAPSNAAAAALARALAALRALAGSYVWATGVMHSAFWTNAAMLAGGAALCLAAQRARAQLGLVMCRSWGRAHHAKVD